MSGKHCPNLQGIFDVRRVSRHILIPVSEEHEAQIKHITFGHAAWGRCELQLKGLILH